MLFFVCLSVVFLACGGGGGRWYSNGSCKTKFLIRYKQLFFLVVHAVYLESLDFGSFLYSVKTLSVISSCMKCLSSILSVLSLSKDTFNPYSHSVVY